MANTSLKEDFWRTNKIVHEIGAPWWLSWLSDWLQLRSWSHGLWVWAPRRTLCWQLRDWSLLRILCLPLSLSLPGSHSFFFSFFFKFFKKIIYLRERERMWVGEGQRQREAKNPKQAPGSELPAQSPMRGSNSQTARSWPEPSWSPNQLSHPGAPRTTLFS